MPPHEPSPLLSPGPSPEAAPERDQPLKLRPAPGSAMQNGHSSPAAAAHAAIDGPAPVGAAPPAAQQPAAMLQQQQQVATTAQPSAPGALATPAAPAFGGAAAPASASPPGPAPASPGERAQEDLEAILARVSQLDPDGWFRHPVREADAPNYYRIIRRPMCFEVRAAATAAVCGLH